MKAYGFEKQDRPCCPGHSPTHKWGLTGGRLPAGAKATMRAIKRTARAAGKAACREY